MSAKTIGYLSEIGGEVEVEWKISDFPLLPGEADERYFSPEFHFSGAAWYLKIYPNGRRNSVTHIGLYLMRGDSGPPVCATYIFGLKTTGGVKEKKFTSEKRVFDKKHRGWGIDEFLLKTILRDRTSELMPSDVLTVTCSLKHDDPSDVTISLLRRLQSVSDSLKDILDEEKNSDVVLKVGEEEFAAHKMILESRSPVFSAMFDHDMEEKRTGVVRIKDIDSEVFEGILSYMYCGEVEDMSPDNACEIYAAADRYDLVELKGLCKAMIQKSLSEKSVCDVIKFSDFYKEDELGQEARKYFNENVKTILKTEAWKSFWGNNKQFATNLLASVIDERL